MTILAIINQKGGVGKTTLTANLAAALAQRGQSVLLVDLDPQANLTSYFGFQPDELEWTLYNALIKRPRTNASQTLAHLSKPTGVDRLTIIPANLELSSAEIEMAGLMGRETLLREALEPFQEEFDWVFIDCPPSLGLLSMNGLTAAEEVLVPFQTEYFARKGIHQLLDVVNLVKKRKINPDLAINGLVGSLYDGRKGLHREVVATVREQFGEKVYQTMIRTNVALAESAGQGKTIFQHAPRSLGSQDYHALAEEFLQRRK